jgi:hypothetical protein
MPVLVSARRVSHHHREVATFELRGARGVSRLHDRDGWRSKRAMRVTVLRGGPGTGCEDTDAHGSGRELQRHGCCSDARDDPCCPWIESGDQARKLVAKRKRCRRRNELAHLLTRAEEQRLDRRVRDSESAPELVVRETAQLAKDQGASLMTREGRDGRPDRIEIGGTDCRRQRIREI